MVYLWDPNLVITVPTDDLESHKQVTSKYKAIELELNIFFYYFRLPMTSIILLTRCCFSN